MVLLLVLFFRFQEFDEEVTTVLANCGLTMKLTVRTVSSSFLLLFCKRFICKSRIKTMKLIQL